MEAMQYTENAFLTLTYNDDTLPFTKAGTPTLVPRDLQLFLKRLRKDTPTRLRFFAVGEYGDASFRPHYHLAGFNFSNCARGETRKSLVSKRCLWRECCSQCSMVGEIWGQGDIEVRGLDASKCEYLARYVTKKMTSKEDARLRGAHPEFSRQSRRPGVGFPGVAKLASTIRQHVDPKDLVDVPLTIKQGKNNHLPLGRYIRNKLRISLGLPEGAPEDVLQRAWEEQVRPVLELAKKDKRNPSLRQAFAARNAPYEAQLQAKMAMKGKGKI